MSELKQTISPAALIAIGAAGVIGSSWLYLGSEFFSNFSVGGTIIGMIVATILAAFVALSYSELATRLPRAGGEVVYAFVATNSLMSFIVGWLLIGAYVSIVAFYVTATGRLLSSVFPALNSMPLYEIGGVIVYFPILAIGYLLTLLILALNWYGAEMSSKVQLILFSIMAVFGAVVVFAGFTNGSASNFFPLFDRTLTGHSPIASIFSFVLPAFSFLTGFGVVVIMAEEVKASSKRIGQIVVLSVLLAGSFYILVLSATAWLLPWKETAAMTNGTIEAFNVAGMPIISKIAFAIGALGIATTFIAVFSASSRLMFALARVGLFPEVFGKLDPKTKSPRVALIFTTVVGLGLGSLGPGALVWFLNIGGVYIGTVWAITVYAMFKIRKMYGNGEANPGFWMTVLPIIGALSAVGIVVAALVPTSPLALLWPYEYLILVAWIALGVLMYKLSPKRLTKEESLKALLGKYYHELKPKDEPTYDVKTLDSNSSETVKAVQTE